ncbi:modification methylase [Aphanothece hegewaldii CCALA 016]|uniref:site-specific DNA-methyltransferase (adenine-specific) n=1 Tax=Aphanothece hegewaldii CCALA 016 TaxID=2107694 RepID=A0A2T1LR50_9CHRO|nr:DNA adenine methylase [Aphanothece hegewaldii]PSF30601.1 modification methylase [Aphanothece hegewaldii CCALA 016]
MSFVKSPLRYPGGKSRAIDTISRYLPEKFSEYREPFVGGGSVFIYLKQKFPHLDIWINDLNSELFLFWKIAQSNLDELIQKIQEVKAASPVGKVLFEEMKTVDASKLSDFERAVRFFVLNRITFSGTVESGGYSEQAFQKRFTDSSISRLSKMRSILKDIKITNLDYSELLKAEGDEVFIFLDPPYLSVTQSRLYGKNGHLHTSFDHTVFSENIRKCSHDWLITYDDCQSVRNNFLSSYIYEWELQYGMNNYKQKRAAKGKELMIVNYPIKPDSIDNEVETHSLEQDHQQLNLFA